LAHNELETASQVGLDGGEIDLTVALRRVTVAGGKKRAWRMHGHIQDRACAQILIVEISGVDARRSAADPPHRRSRRKSHGAEEGMVQRDDDARRYLGGLRLAVELDDPLPEGREVIGKRAPVRTLTVVGVIRDKIDPENPYLEHIARHGAIHINR